MSQYEVYHDGEVVGKVCVEKDGLYYSIKCKCCLQKNGLYKLFWDIAGVIHNIGVCIPSGEAMEVCTKIPISRVGGVGGRFYVASGDNPGRTVFPAKSDLPFPRVDMLRRGQFSKGECPGIVFSGESVSCLQKNQ